MDDGDDFRRGDGGREEVAWAWAVTVASMVTAAVATTRAVRAARTAGVVEHPVGRRRSAASGEEEVDGGGDSEHSASDAGSH